MIQKIKTYTHLWLQGFEILVEADSNNSIPCIEIIGLPDAAIKEAKERIRATFRNLNISMPAKKFILNLAPSDLKKVGTRFDVPMAVALLLVIFEDEIVWNVDFEKSLFFGELWLDGKVKSVTWLLPCVVSALKEWYTQFFVPEENIYELEYIPWITLYPLYDFKQLTDLFLEWKNIVSHQQNRCLEDVIEDQTRMIDVDFAHIKWHLLPKRALALAAAWSHNVLLVWAPGSWKTFLVKAFQSILPPLSFEEILELSQIYSVVGKLDKHMPLITQRPFRQVHHTASKVSVVGWWSALTPWEVSLAHKWILFFDELTEFPRAVLDVLRQPLEDRQITISRVSGTIQYPANVLFVGAMNPCICGYYKDREKPCTCSLMSVKKYQQKISGPLLDRIDVILEIPRESLDTILNPADQETSQQIRDRVLSAWRRQQERFAGTGIYANAHMTPKHLEQYVPLDQSCKDFLLQATQHLLLSPRVIHRIIKLARTIADMEDKEYVDISCLAEALQYRTKTLFVDSEI